MANQVFIEDSDLYRRCGGQAALTQLMDPHKTGKWDPGVSLIARQDACNLVLSAVGVQNDLGGIPASEFAAKFPNLVTIASQKAIALCWLYGCAGQAVPDRITDYDQKADAELEKLSLRRRKNGASDFTPTLSNEINGAISMDPNSNRMTLASWRDGWC